MSIKLLFLLKEHLNSNGYYNCKSGLWNSANFVKESLEDDLNYESKITTVIDGNGIDREVHLYKPTHVILEAIWCPPCKLIELSKLYPKVKWIIRVHSKTPFLANEGIALTWIKEYNKINNVTISFNNIHTNNEFYDLGIKAAYLPNIYYPKEVKLKSHNSIDQKFNELYQSIKRKDVINIGCFGAIRPLKNQLQQAISAINYAEEKGKILFFHINAQRLEQRGEEILKNIRALFNESGHQLVEWGWYDHNEFVYLVKQMDLGLQVSLTESFNIVTADFVNNNIPIIVSKDIDWIPNIFRANPLNSKNIIKKIKIALFLKRITTLINKSFLTYYNISAINTWLSYFKGSK